MFLLGYCYGKAHFVRIHNENFAKIVLKFNKALNLRQENTFE